MRQEAGVIPKGNLTVGFVTHQIYLLNSSGCRFGWADPTTHYPKPEKGNYLSGSTHQNHRSNWAGPMGHWVTQVAPLSWSRHPLLDLLHPRRPCQCSSSILARWRSAALDRFHGTMPVCMLLMAVCHPPARQHE
jgi:hypothetical protein